MNKIVVIFLRALALAWLALGMSVPVSAWTVHKAAHVAAQISVDVHHHHGEDGRISVHVHDDGEAPDGGHDQMPSILLGVATVPDAGILLTEPTGVRQKFATSAAHVALRNVSDGLRRPPRLG